MKNREIFDLQNSIEDCIGRFHKTQFCLGLAHNKRKLLPVVEAIREAMEKAEDQGGDFKRELTEYRQKVSDALSLFALKNEKGEAVMAGVGAYKILPEKMEEVGAAIKFLRESAGDKIRKYLDKIDEINDGEYSGVIDFYKIKPENLPENLGIFADRLYLLIGE
jgi:hypothetical protein